MLRQSSNFDAVLSMSIATGHRCRTARSHPMITRSPRTPGRRALNDGRDEAGHSSLSWHRDRMALGVTFEITRVGQRKEWQPQELSAVTPVIPMPWRVSTTAATESIVVLDISRIRGRGAA
jgi:hypothetical protein